MDPAMNLAEAGFGYVPLSFILTHSVAVHHIRFIAAYRQLTCLRGEREFSALKILSVHCVR